MLAVRKSTVGMLALFGFGLSFMGIALSAITHNYRCLFINVMVAGFDYFWIKTSYFDMEDEKNAKTEA